MLYEISPVFHAARIRRPLIVLQGANDPRVLKAESDDIVNAVKKNGVPVEYIVFPEEGHGFTKKKDQIEGYNAVLKFLDTHLKNKRGVGRKHVARKHVARGTSHVARRTWHVARGTWHVAGDTYPT